MLEVKMKKPEYMVINDGPQFTLYRKLFKGEYIWYRDELYRLRMYKNELWLKLDTDENKEILEAKIKQNELVTRRAIDKDLRF